jgi:hypothetical protein
MREEHRLRVFENRELRRIFGPKREEDGSWTKLHNDELHSLYSSSNIVRVIKSRRMRWAGSNMVRVIKSRRMRWAGHVARLREGRFSNNILHHGVSE